MSSNNYLQTQHPKAVRRLLRASANTGYQVTVIQQNHPSILREVKALLQQEFPQKALYEVPTYQRDYAEIWEELKAIESGIIIIPDFHHIIQDDKDQRWGGFNMMRDWFVGKPIILILVLPQGEGHIRQFMKRLFDFWNIVTLHLEFYKAPEEKVVNLQPVTEDYSSIANLSVAEKEALGRELLTHLRAPLPPEYWQSTLVDLGQLGQVYSFLTEAAQQEAITLANQFVETLMASEQELPRPFWRKVSKLYQNIGQQNHAIALFEKAIELAENDSHLKGIFFNELGELTGSQGKYSLAIKYVTDALKLSQKSEDKEIEGEALNNIGHLHTQQGDYDTALEFLNQSLSIRRDIGDRAGKGTTLNNIGSIHQAKGDYDTALEFLKQSLSITRDIGDRAGEGTTLNNMSIIAYAKGDYDSALEFLNQSLSIRRDIGDRAEEGATLNNISSIHQAKGDYDTALEFLNQSLSIQRAIGDSSGLWTTLHNMAHIAWQKEDVEQYMAYELEAWQIASQIGDAQGIYHVGKDLGAKLCHYGNTEQGLPLLQAALAAGQRMGVPGIEELERLIANYQL